MENISSMSVFNLVLQADIVVQGVMLILVVASMVSWALIFDKFIKFRLLKHRTARFEDQFESQMIEDVYKIASKNNNHPLAMIFMACMDEWMENKIKKVIDGGAELKNSLKERLVCAMQIGSNNSMIKFQKGMNILAIIGSTAPFVGLFGTVWGILNSFQGIAVMKNTSLAVVAPGIAEALLATALGLFAAIPAVFFYNIFSSRINAFTEEMESFSMKLLNVLSRELDR